MNSDVTLPELGENIDHAIIASVLVAVGDQVEIDQALCEVETDKAVAELPSPGNGVIAEIRIGDGDEVAVGQVLMVLSSNGASAADAKADPRPSPAAPAPSSAPEAAPESAPAPTPAASTAPVITTPPVGARPGTPDYEVAPQALAPAGPAARRLAREMGFEITEVEGSGPRGRISIADVKAHASKVITSGRRGRPASGIPSVPELPDFSQWGEIETRPMNAIRRVTADSMATAWAQIPHVTQADRADITELDAQRRAWSTAEAKLTVTAVILKAVASALRRYEQVNASLDSENHALILKRYVHLGVAVDTENGLLVPVVRDADKKNAITIATEVADLAARARKRKLKLEEMQGATFTVTNLGGLGTTYFSPIVSWPQVAILGVGRANIEPVWRESEFVPRLILPLSISYDHRAIDGADAARFLRWIAEALEQPLKLVVEG